jgi:phosphoglycolate phosphatase
MATIIFDLDGTLINSAAIVLPAFRKTLENFPTAPAHTDETLRKTFGIPDKQIWEMLLPNATESERMEAYDLTERYIGDAMSHTSVLIPHAIEVLTELKAAGHTLTVASNCGVKYLNEVLDTQGLRKFFTEPLCLESVNGRVKADILAKHFERFSKEDAVMVGDRSSDVEAANAHGIPTVGCQFGFGDESEIAGAAVIIRDLRELLPLFPREGSPLLLPHGRR